MKNVLPVIVLSQFLCTSLWFAGNAVLNDIVKSMPVPAGFLAHITSAVQFGFIAGTFIFALLNISDRFSPSRVFFICAIAAAISNFFIAFQSIGFAGIIACRFGTGFFLAGIYPVGMKLAADHFKEGLGRSLGFLVGALVLGTSFPHLLKAFSVQLSWHYVVYATSLLSVAGGIAIWLWVPDGPYRKAGRRIQFSAFFTGFSNPKFRAAAFGYFGHMWELYTFWAFIPFMLASYVVIHPQAVINIPLTSFCIIAAGGISCFVSGYLSRRFQTKK